MNENVIAAERFNPQLRNALAAILDTMIPADSEFSAPSAGSEAIVNDVIQTMTGSSADEIVDLLRTLQETHGKPFNELDDEDRWRVFVDLERSNPHTLRVLGGLALQCYYRNDETLVSLGMEARTPFPLGHKVADGDWSLLNPVRARGKIYREV